MGGGSQCMVVTALCCVLAAAMWASVEGAWILWVEEPAGSDQWSLAHIPEPRFKVKEDCERSAQAFNDLERTFAKMERAEAHDVFSCLPDSVDPRPEAVVILDSLKPPEPKQK